MPAARRDCGRTVRTGLATRGAPRVSHGRPARRWAPAGPTQVRLAGFRARAAGCGDSVNLKPDGTPYRMVGIPDGLGAFDNGDGTFTVLMNHELPNSAGIVRAHGAAGAFVSKWIIRTSDLTVLHGEDLIKTLNTWNPALNGGAGGWQVSNTDAAPARINRLCSAELTPWLGNMSFENVVAHPNTGSDATVTIGLDDGDASVGQQVYLYRGTKTDAGNPVQKAGLVGGKLYGIKVAGIPQSEYLKTDWAVGNTFDFQLVDVSQ